MTFEETSLNDNILDALYDMRFDKCTPIQEKCIPEILRGSDVLGIAQTGTGKTAAYLLPILSMLDDGTFPPDAAWQCMGVTTADATIRNYVDCEWVPTSSLPHRAD